MSSRPSCSWSPGCGSCCSDRAGGRLPGLGWSTRETAFLVHLMKVAGIAFLLVAALTLTIGTLDP